MLQLQKRRKYLSEEVLKEAVKKYDTAAARGVIHKNAANKKRAACKRK